jgi:hypothetical protein
MFFDNPVIGVHLMVLSCLFDNLISTSNVFLILILITCVIPLEKNPPKKETIPLQLLKKKSNNQATLVLYFLHLLIWIALLRRRRCKIPPLFQRYEAALHT